MKLGYALWSHRAPVLVAVAAWALVVGCQEVKEPTTTLTQAQWEEVRQNLLPAPPASYTHKVGANFGDKIELLGVDVDPPSPKAGREVTITWYFKALAPMNVNWQVFVHMDHLGDNASRQGMDHHPIRDLYQTSRWKVGEIVKDEQKVRIRADYPGGDAKLFVGLWNPANDERLPLKNPDKIANDGGNRIEAATLTIVGGPKSKKAKGAAKPPRKAYTIRRLAGDITIDGKLDDPAWKQAAKTSHFGGANGGPGPKGATWAQLAYDDTKLYIGLYGEDTDVWGSLTERDAKTWTEEVFEVFLDPNGDAKDYLEIQVTPRNTVFDARFAVQLGRGTGSRDAQIDVAKAWNSALESAVSIDGSLNNPADTDRSWSAELAIPLSEIPGGQARPGQMWSLNLYRFDAPRDAQGKPKGQVAWAWSPAKGSFHNVKNFGSLRFIGTSPAPVGTPTPTLQTPPAKAPTAPTAVSKDESPPDKPE